MARVSKSDIVEVVVDFIGLCLIVTMLALFALATPEQGSAEADWEAVQETQAESAR